jgi:uncharacterized Zn finger protein (UPF0148 family)
MSRATHDAKCDSCGFAGTVNDEAIVCPKCGQTIEGVPISPERLSAMLEKFRAKAQELQSTATRGKEIF